MRQSVLRMLFVLTMLSLALLLSAQVSVTGRVIGSDVPGGLSGATITLVSANNEYDTESGQDGSFTINNVQGSAAGVQYNLTISFEGYQEHASQRLVRQENLNIGNIVLNEKAWGVTNLVATENDDGDEMHLVWNKPKPVTGTEQWLYWDSGVNQTSIGTNTPAEFAVAQRFTPAQLEEADVVGLYITTIRFFPTYADAQYTARVHRGGSGNPLNPGQLITSQLATNVVINNWNEVVLDNPVEILPNQEIWFGYHINTQGGLPAGCDAGPVVNNFGNLMFLNNRWQTLSSINPQFTYNWNIHAWAGFMRGERSISLNPSIQDDVEQISSVENVDISLFSKKLNNETNISSVAGARSRRIAERDARPLHYRELEGYQVFIFNVDDEEEPEDWTRLAEITDTVYVHTGWGDMEAGYYRYAVQAVYTNDVFSDYALTSRFPQGLRFNVTGRVLASDTNEGVAGAKVTFEGIEEHEVETGADGSFTLSRILGDLEEVQYELKIKTSGYQTHTSEHNVTNVNLNLGNIVLNEMAYPAFALHAELNEDDEVDLSWTEPFPAIEQWLHWCDEGIHSGIGTGQEAQFSVASRFTPAMLEELDVVGLDLQVVRFVPYVAAATYTIKVWRGGNGTPLNPGQEITSQVVTNINGQEWNEVVLNSPVRILEGQELWFGYHVNTPTGHPAGADGGPAIDGFGNLMFLNNRWQTLLEIAEQLDNNWSLEGFAGYPAGGRNRSLSIDNVELTQPDISPFFAESAHVDISKLSAISYEKNTSSGDHLPSRRSLRNLQREEISQIERSFESYTIYRYNIDDEDNQEDWTELATNHNSLTFTDTTWDELPAGAYRYAVVARYTNGIFSTPAISNMLLKDMLCFVTVRLTSNSEDPVEGAVVKLTNTDGNPEHIYSEVAPENGVVVFNDVWRGRYDVEIKHPKYEKYTAENLDIDDVIFVHPVELIEELREVLKLTHEVFNGNNVLLSWDEPSSVSGTPRWIHWDSGINNDGIGTNTPAQFMVAARFTYAQLGALDVQDLHITQVKFFPREAAATYTVKVWRGGSGAPLNPGEEVHSQLVRELVNSAWNTVVLTPPVEIKEDQELWIGYHVNTPGGHPAGVDAGPKTTGYGNLMYLNNGWTTLDALNPDFNFNWNIQAYAGVPTRGEEVLISRNRAETIERDKSSNRALLGYKIIRNNDIIAQHVETLYYRDTSLKIGNYTYKVIAQYTTGESEPVTTEEIVILSADEEVATPLVTKLHGNYPNPFNPETSISFSLAGRENVQIDIFNLKGQKIRSLINEAFDSGNHTVVWDGKSDGKTDVGSGIYFYKMISGDYSTTKKMIMMK